MARKARAARNAADETEENERGSNLPGQRDLAHHLKIISTKAQAKADADMALASAYSAAEECGLDKKAIKTLLKLKKDDSEKSAAHYRTLIQYAQWMDLPIGAQLHFFDEPTDDPEAKVRAEGRAAGKEGASANTNPYPENSKMYPVWEEGRMQGQAALVGGGGNGSADKPKRGRGRPKKSEGEELH